MKARINITRDGKSLERFPREAEPLDINMNLDMHGILQIRVWNGGYWTFPDPGDLITIEILKEEKERDAWHSKWHESREIIRTLNIDLSQLQSAFDKAMEACQQYGNREQWSKEVIDSHSGECCLFDWEGELANEPWEFAEKALSTPNALAWKERGKKGEKK